MIKLIIDLKIIFILSGTSLKPNKLPGENSGTSRSEQLHSNLTGLTTSSTILPVGLW